MASPAKRLRIAVDAMGGDHAPAEIVKGAVEAARELPMDIILSGRKGDIERELGRSDTSDLNISIVEAEDVIKDGQEAAFEVFRRPNNSVSVAASQVKDGKADAVVSAGNTGAFMVAAMQQLGTLPGIDRPMVGGAFLGLAPQTVVLDLGAVVGAQPYHMVNFATAGTVYARSFMNIDNPTVGLLNVGAEEGKGNDLAKESYPLLQKSGLNFIGNVEGMDIVQGKANVIVCDGFVGNILVKFCEGLGQGIRDWMKNELKQEMPQDKLEDVIGRLYRLMSPATAMGGGPMWGVNGVACVAHGSSKAAQIIGTIRQARQAIDSGFVDKLRNELERIQKLVTE